jgi:large subunit ribosomal protein LP0
MPGNEKKTKYLDLVKNYLTTYTKALLVNADNVGSNQLQKIRISLRGKAVVLMGKNTLIRRALRQLITTNKQLEILLPQIKQNVGLVLTNGDLTEIKKIITECRVAAPAKTGSVAPVDVIVPAGPTGMDPTMTTFLQALNIASKINKGQVEIVSDVHLIKKGSKVGSSEATLLEKLKIFPFSYGLTSISVYDNGSSYAATVLDYTAEDALAAFALGVGRVTGLSLGISYPNATSVPHMLLNGYKRILSVGFGTTYTFKQLDALKNAAAAAPAPAPVKEKEAPKKEEKKEEKKKEPEPAADDDDMGMGLFD